MAANNSQHGYFCPPESLESVRAARQVDLRDLWRIVQKDIEKECSDDQSDTGSTSTELLKHQITFEIEALKTRLEKKEAALGDLNNTTRPTQDYCHRTSSNSPLVDALDISVKVPACDEHSYCRCQHQLSPCRACCQLQQPGHRHGNRTAPLARRHTCHMAAQHTDLSTSSSTSGVSSTNGDYCHLHSEHCDSGHSHEAEQPFSQCNNGSDTPVADKDENSSAEVRVSSSCDGIVDSEAVDFDINAASVQVMRRPSYKSAIENAASTAEDVDSAGGTTYSFQSAMENGQISPTGPPQSVSTSPDGDTMPENDSLRAWNVTAPRFSSTPLPQSRPNILETHFHSQMLQKCVSSKVHTKHETKQFENSDIKDSGIHKQVIDKTDNIQEPQVSMQTSGKCDINRPNDMTEVKMLSNKDNTVAWSLASPTGVPSSGQSSAIQAAIQADILKVGGMQSNRSPHCSNHRLSVLLEEDAHGESGDSAHLHSGQHMSSFYMGSSSNILSTPQLEYSAEIWTLSGSCDMNQSKSAHGISSNSSEIDQLGDSSEHNQFAGTSGSSSEMDQLGNTSETSKSALSSNNTSKINLSSNTSEPHQSGFNRDNISELNQSTASGNCSASHSENSSGIQGDESKYVWVSTDMSCSSISSPHPVIVVSSPSTPSSSRAPTYISSLPILPNKMVISEHLLSPTFSSKQNRDRKSGQSTLEETREKLAQLTKMSPKPEMSLVSLAMIKLSSKQKLLQSKFMNLATSVAPDQTAQICTVIWGDAGCNGKLV